MPKDLIARAARLRNAGSSCSNTETSFVYSLTSIGSMMSISPMGANTRLASDRATEPFWCLLIPQVYELINLFKLNVI